MIDPVIARARRRQDSQIVLGCDISSDPCTELFPHYALGDIVRGMHNSGEPIRPVSGEAFYDEDDVNKVDVASQFGRDSFELRDAASDVAMQAYFDRKKSKSPDPKPVDPDSKPTDPVSSE